MKRKIVKLGPATLVVSLPSKWIKKYSINPGDEIELEEQDRDLLIKSKKGHKIARENVDLTGLNALLKRIVASKYLKGADEIEVKVDSLEKSRTVQKRVSEMIGMEIIEQSKDKLLIKDMGGNADDTFDSILRRVVYLLDQVSDESLKAIKNRETNLDYLADMELNINRFTDYCFRLLNKRGYADTKKTAVLYCILLLLEELGDEYKKFISYVNDNKIKLNDDLIRLYVKINVCHKNFESLFLKFSYENAVALAKERDRIVAEVNQKVKSSKNAKDIVILKHFENIADIIVKLMGQILNLN